MSLFSRYLAPKAAPSVTASAPIQTTIIEVAFTSIISADMRSKGDIEISGNLRIDGVHEGNIIKSPFCDKEITVHVAETGRVTGRIDVDNIIVDGIIDGITRAYNNLYIQGTVKGGAFYVNTLSATGNILARLTKVPPPTPMQNSTNVHVLHT